VELIGPPLVVIATVSKICHEPMIVSIRTRVRTGRSSGIVMRQKIFHSVAPSMAAAS
jgi:hypothetical protein